MGVALQSWASIVTNVHAGVPIQSDRVFGELSGGAGLFNPALAY
jgi:hypothetical protein